MTESTETETPTEIETAGGPTIEFPDALRGQPIATALPALVPMLEGLYLENLKQGVVPRPGSSGPKEGETPANAAVGSSAVEGGPATNGVHRFAGRDDDSGTFPSANAAGGAAGQRAAAVKPFTVGGVVDILAWEKPEGHDLIYDDAHRTFLARGELGVVFGQGGVGKSRLAMNWAFHQALGRKTPIFNFTAQPLKWLFISNENGLGRLQHDMRRMTQGMTPGEIETIQRQVRMTMLMTPEDDDICIGSADVCAKMLATLQQEQPDLLILDPWANVLDGDPIDNADSKRSLMTIRFLLNRAKMSQTATIILAHARPGKGNIIQATGYNAANFGSGAKTLMSSARFVINMGPASETDYRKVLVACGKTNNAPPFEPVGLILNDETMFYEIDPSFDLDVWKEEVEGKKSGGKAKAGVSIQDVCQVVASFDRSSVERAEAAKRLMAVHGPGRSKAYEFIADAETTGHLSAVKPTGVCLTDKGRELVEGGGGPGGESAEPEAAQGDGAPECHPQTTPDGG